jgi:RNA-directed DNA polymerase
MNELKSSNKPFDISKRAVWEAYQRVKAKQGAAGVDGQTIAEFEKDLKGNLYRIWNRMSSGTYFPPPVKAVEIPKTGGGVRVLGVPTVSDRIAQTVAARSWRKRWNLYSTPIPSGTGRAGRRRTRWPGADGGAGRTTG